MTVLKSKLANVKASAERLQQSPLVRNTLWMLFAQGIRLVLQAAYFVIIARTLGPEQYGAFVGTAALISILGPFSSLGSGYLLIKNASRNRALLNEYWGNALFLILTSGLGLTLGVCLLAPMLLPKTIPPLMVLLIGITDLVLLRLMDTAGQAFQAVLRLKKTAQINILPSVTRILAALALTQFFSHPNALNWTVLYLISTATASAVAFCLVYRDFGRPKLALQRIRPEMLEGLYFSGGLAAKTIYNDIDKTMLARLASLEAVGLYAAAYRLIDVSFVPVRSLLAASYAKFFQYGAGGIREGLKLTRRLIPLAAAYGMIAALGLFIFAPIITSILGQEYAETVNALRWLALLPLLKSLHYFAADTLTGAGFQGVRFAVQVSIAVLNILINFWLIPAYSWEGAAWASLASDSLLALSLWLAVLYYACR